MKSKAAPSETAEPVKLGARVGLVSDYDKTVFFHFLIAERSARAKLQPQP